MKILLHTPWGVKKDFIGGTEHFVIDMAKSLNKKGHEAFIICPNVEAEITIWGVIFYNLSSVFTFISIKI